MSIVAEAVAGAALSTFFDVLFDNLSSPDLLKIFRQKNVDADLKKWKRTLLKIHAVLEDAEERQMTSRLVKIWLDELEDLVYDVDDILDEFATEALRRKLHEEERSTSKIQKFIPACCAGFNPSSIMFDVSMRSKIEGINTRLQEIVTERVGLKLNDGAGGRTITKTSRPPTSSLLEGQTYGRNKDKEEIVKLLLKSSDAQLSVISIVGMGGLGKTTLAQLVYNDDKVSDYFKLKAWVCASENFDIVRLTKEILHFVTPESCHDNNNLDLLQRKLQEKLSENKFLLVLDDVWCENYENWTILCKPFESRAQGSKILVTTRNDGVASTMRATARYKLKELHHDDCLHVFTHHALDATDFSKYSDLEEIGKKIVHRCKGAPLAAKVLGCLLRTTHNRNDWEHVLNSKIWDIPEEKNSIFSSLILSYNHLPSHLKRCFAYCSLFPKDYEFEEKELVLLWMAEGLVQETKEKKPMEDLGSEYFRDLLNRSFFQQSRSRNKSLFVMHDLMNDLAKWASGDLCYRLEDQLDGSKQFEISTKVRHFSYIKHSNDCIQNFDDFPKDMNLRTFLLLSSNQQLGNLTNFDAKYCLLPQLRCLRVLSLSGYKILKLPSSIGDLKHLRYLNVSCTEITSLPESTSSLYKLQTLILKGCDSLTKLPKNIEKLVNLRHLNITNANLIREMPVGIAKLKSLQKLCFENMCEWQDWITCKFECEEFPCLRELSISNCPKLQQKFPHHLPSLEKLSIYACEQLVVSIPNHSVLQELKIVKCKKVVHESVKIEKLIIEKCEELTSLCQDGLMSLVTQEVFIKSCQSLVNIKLKSTLRTLTIDDCSGLESLQFVMDEGGASSTSSLLMNKENLSCIGNNNVSLLEHLKITNCLSLKCVSSIVDVAAMLKQLQIIRCPNLTSLSSRDTLPTTALKVLKVVYCPKLESIVDKLHKDTLLEYLLIHSCEKLRCLRLHELYNLKDIDIQDCNSLISLGDLAPTELRRLVIENCEKLEALPNNMHNLNFLGYLSIHNCSSIVSFPKKGFPTNLREIWLIGANLCTQIFELGLHKLTSLTLLNINGGIMDSFPEEEDGKTMLMLPTSLTALCFHNFPNLLFLSWKFFQNHSALEEIEIGWCPKLASLSEKCFPSSLRKLDIKYCPVLKQNYEKGKGIMWSKIANIPSIIIDGVEQQQ